MSCSAKTQKGTNCTRKCTNGKFCKIHQKVGGKKVKKVGGKKVKKVGGKKKEPKYFGICPYCKNKVDDFNKDIIRTHKNGSGWSFNPKKYTVFRCSKCDSILSIGSASQYDR